jgi:Family of unknown function (DUF6493)
VSLLHERDIAEVRDELVGLKEKERRARAKDAEKAIDSIVWYGPRRPPTKRRQAVVLTWLGTATARKIVSEYWRVGFELGDDPRFMADAYTVLRARGRAFFETLARNLLRSDTPFGGWVLVRTAVRDGFIDPPAGDEYVRGVVWGILGTREHDNVTGAYDALLADPSLLDREVWQLFEIDAGAELSRSATWGLKDADNLASGYARGDNRWIYALARLAEEGRLDRARLLDASLDALTRDFRASTVGWYAKFHEELEPTRDERVARLDRYLSLVASPTPLVAKAGLTALRAVEDVVPAEQLARVAPSAFTHRQKSLATDTLACFTRLCKTQPDARPVLLDAAAEALAHERADVQERALKLLEAYPDDAPRAVLLGYVEAVSPTLRERVAALTGVEAPVDPAPARFEIGEPRRPSLVPDDVRATRERLQPVESVDDLVELTATLLEGQGGGDDCERFLDGVSRLCDTRAPDFERRTSALARRAADLRSPWFAGLSGQDIVAFVAAAWLVRMPLPKLSDSGSSVISVLAGRAAEVARRARRSVARPLLAMPTHRGGWIDPEVLETRLAQTGRVFNRPDALDKLQAGLRAFPDFEPPVYARRVETVTRWGHATENFTLRLPGRDDLGELAPVLRGVGAPNSESFWYGMAGWGGSDALGVRWSLTAFPSHPSVAFAGAATTAVEARDGAAYGHPDAVIEHALDARVPLGPEAWLATAACLVAKAPDLPRVATDLLVASADDGRFDAGALGDALAWLADNDLAKLNRLEGPLRDLARVSALHAAQSVRVVECLLANLESQPRTVHSVLGLAVEGSTVSGRKIEDERARAKLERMAAGTSRSSKLGKLAHALLAQ